MKHAIHLEELSTDDLEHVSGGSVNVCTVFGGLAASGVGFGLAAAGVATAGWGALAGLGVYAICEFSGVNSNGTPGGVDMSQLDFP